MASFVPRPLFSYNKSLGMHRTEGWLDPRAGVAAAQKIIFLHSIINWSLDYWTSSDLVTTLIEISQSAAYYWPPLSNFVFYKFSPHSVSSTQCFEGLKSFQLQGQAAQEGTRILWNVGNYSLDTLACPKWLESSATLLQEPQISQHHILVQLTCRLHIL